MCSVVKLPLLVKLAMVSCFVFVFLYFTGSSLLNFTKNLLLLGVHVLIGVVG